VTVAELYDELRRLIARYDKARDELIEVGEEMRRVGEEIIRREY
jgi:hypothetical protein